MLANQFAGFFAQLSGHSPFRWQEHLYKRLVTGDIPHQCDIPTGLGKTSILAIWLLALADQVAQGGTRVTLPRRLVYIVDRRAVVDQATVEAERLLTNLCEATDLPLLAVANALRGLAAASGGLPFALSTLRGQFADNREWSRDPSRPAIIVGTVDMVGSRLLFSGYGGLGRYGRSQHAALLGQDALVILDEAQLAPAFMQTLVAVESRVHFGTERLGRPFAVMSLTATQPRSQDLSIPTFSEGLPVVAKSTRKSFTLEPEDIVQEKEVRQRVQAPKAMRFLLPESLITGKTDDALVQRMAQEAVALAEDKGAVVVFVNTVALLDKVRDALCAVPYSIPAEDCLRFNGQMRGYERDLHFSEDPKLANEVYQTFRRRRRDRGERSHPVFLLATSAGEVGVNFDADHAVCDLVSLERMAQRLGRVNRAGDGAAKITVFLSANPAKLERPELVVTHHLLSQLPEFVGTGGAPELGVYSASPAALREILNHPDAARAYTPTSNPPPLDSARLDDWSLTSLHPNDFPRPQVSYWLRGITPDDEQAVTYLVWREELRYAVDGADAADMAATRSPLPREILQLPTHRAVKWLLARAKKHVGTRKKQANPFHGDYTAIRMPSGEWGPQPLTWFENKDDFEQAIVGAIIILPTTFGGLPADGLINEIYEDKAVDVLEKATGPDAATTAKRYRRALLSALPDNRWVAFDLLAGPASTEVASGNSYSALVAKLARYFHDSSTGQNYRLMAREWEPDASVGEDGEQAQSSVYRVAYFASTQADVETADTGDEPSLRNEAVCLQKHLEQTKSCAERIVSGIELPPLIKEAVVMAAQWHDLGKHRENWQRAVGNPDPGNPDPSKVWAKSPNPYFKRQETQGYRHEFGSMMDAAKEPTLQIHLERELILHLIAAHHGHGRPGFDKKAYDVPKYLSRQCIEAAAAAELRFDKLQRRFGWWGLAYLEALVKCADALASGMTEAPRFVAGNIHGALAQAELFSPP